MINYTLKILVLVAVYASAQVTVNAETNCSALLDKALSTDLTLEYEEFDQTQGKGFRYLVDKECPKEAADLIEAYIDSNDATQSSLVWHIAQLRATHGDYEEALKFARKSLDPAEDLSSYPLRWNNYVRGVIAFLESDKKALVLHRDEVAKGVDAHFGNKLNLNVLDSLITHFERSYAYASSQVGK